MSDEEKRLKDVMFGRRAVVIAGEINEESVGDVRRRLLLLQAESNDRINLLIDSGGGYTSAALDLCDVIAHIITAPVRCVVVGQCMSAATFILLHCAERIATPNSRFKIHSSISQISITLDSSTSESLENLHNQSRVTAEKLIAMYMEKLCKSREDVLALITRGDQQFNSAMWAQEALEIGLIQQIIDGKLDIFGPVPAQQ